MVNSRLTRPIIGSERGGKAIVLHPFSRENEHLISATDNFGIGVVWYE